MWILKTCTVSPTKKTYDLAKKAWQDSRQDCLKDCAADVGKQRVLEELDATDIAYNTAIKHAVDAIDSMRTDYY